MPFRELMDTLSDVDRAPSPACLNHGAEVEMVEVGKSSGG